MNKLFTKFSAVALFAMLSGNAMATDYYLSANGVDTNDGTSAEKAVATLSKGVSLLKSSEDILHVSGLIPVTSQVNVSNKNFEVKIQGGNAATDGFTGNNQEVAKGILVLGNVKFELKNLRFENAKLNADTEGAILTMGNINGVIDGCVFAGNVTENTNNNSTAGAIKATGTNFTDAGLVIKNSQFLNNSTKASGGAATIANMPVTIENCTFIGNVAYTNGGALNLNATKSYTIKNCKFINNAATGAGTNACNGGAIRAYFRNYVTSEDNEISYSTFYGNKTDGAGSCFSVDVNDEKDNRTLKFTNCTMTANTTTRGNGSAVNIYGPKGEVTIANSILESNVSGSAYIDLINSNDNKSTITINNSVIGNISGYTAELYPSTASCINKTAKSADTKYAGLAAYDDENKEVTLYVKSLAAINKMGATEKTVTPTDGMMYASSLKEDGSLNEVTICRHLVGGQWNTICLPFHLNNANEDVNKPSRTEFSTYFGEGAKVACLSGGTVSDGILKFSDRSTYNNSDIVAARAYIVKPTEDRDIVITKAVVNTNPGSQVGSPKDNSNYKFVGVLAPTDLSTVKTTGQIVCLGKDGKFFTPEEGKTTINGLRGYFIFPASENAARFSIGINGGGTTGINDVKAQDAVKNAKIYTLGGQYMGTNANNLPQGVYVIGSKKVVVK